MIPAGSDIKSVKDLEGKSVATPGLGGAVMMSVQYQIKKAGADPAAVRFVQMPFAAMVDQMKAGRIQAALAANPFIGIMEKAGARSLGNPFLVLSDETVTLLWQTTPAFAAANRAALAGWRAAYKEALAYIASNEDDARMLLVQELKVTPEVAKSAILSKGAVDVRAQDLDVWLTVLQGLDMVKPGAVRPAKDLIVGD
jgi:NitT/TauT family transport system substrate-binding protein